MSPKNFEVGDVWEHETGLRYRVLSVRLRKKLGIHLALLERVGGIKQRVWNKHSREVDNTVGWKLMERSNDK
jgi:hypothetical protein